MKGRRRTNGRPQREYITKEESSSPTVSLYAVKGSCLMDTINNRRGITINIPGVFLQSDWPQEEHPGYIMFEGIIVDVVCKIDPSYQDKIIWRKDRKKKFLYGRLIKAVYGTLLGAIIFHNKQSKHLIDYSFVKNEYDMCTFNKMVNSKQITVQLFIHRLPSC